MQELCNEEMIPAFPTIRIYRHGSDDIVMGGNHVKHGNLYKGDRTEEALTAFVDDLARDANPSPTAETGSPRRPRQGCMVALSCSLRERECAALPLMRHPHTHVLHALPYLLHRGLRCTGRRSAQHAPVPNCSGRSCV